MGICELQAQGVIGIVNNYCGKQRAKMSNICLQLSVILAHSACLWYRTLSFGDLVYRITLGTYGSHGSTVGSHWHAPICHVASSSLLYDYWLTV